MTRYNDELYEVMYMRLRRANFVGLPKRNFNWSRKVGLTIGWGIGIRAKIGINLLKAVGDGGSSPPLKIKNDDVETTTQKEQVYVRVNPGDSKEVISTNPYALFIIDNTNRMQPDAKSSHHIKAMFHCDTKIFENTDLTGKTHKEIRNSLAVNPYVSKTVNMMAIAYKYFVRESALISAAGADYITAVTYFVHPKKGYITIILGFKHAMKKKADMFKKPNRFVEIVAEIFLNCKDFHLIYGTNFRCLTSNSDLEGVMITGSGYSLSEEQIGDIMENGAFAKHIFPIDKQRSEEAVESRKKVESSSEEEKEKDLEIRSLKKQLSQSDGAIRKMDTDISQMKEMIMNLAKSKESLPSITTVSENIPAPVAPPYTKPKTIAPKKKENAKERKQREKEEEIIRLKEEAKIEKIRLREEKLLTKENKQAALEEKKRLEAQKKSEELGEPEEYESEESEESEEPDESEESEEPRKRNPFAFTVETQEGLPIIEEAPEGAESDE